MRCPVCEHENQVDAKRCEACDEVLNSYDLPEALERYQRAFDKLTANGTLSEKGAHQCTKLREKLNISDAFHEKMLATLISEDEEEESELTIAISWMGEPNTQIALIHKGDFTFEQVELGILSTLTRTIYRERLEDVDPDDRQLFTAPLYDGQKDQGSLLALGIQIQIRTVDITDEVQCYRTPLISLSGGEVELVDLQGQTATSLHDLFERRALFSLLGSEGWREIPLQKVTEDEYFQWEVKVAATKDWLRRSSADGWRVGDQRTTSLGDVQFYERLCPGGISWIGAPLGVGRDWETPAHQVKISGPLWCSETPVTQSLWTEIMGTNPSARHIDQAPVDSITWFDAIHFCNRLSKRLGLSPAYRITKEGRVLKQGGASGYRLPSEAEWEHLARGGLDRVYAGSNRAEQVCWSIENSDHQSQEVGQKLPNAWGLFDFCGNVWEWCEDYFVEDTYRRRIGVFSDPCVLAVPQGKSEANRVRRGGSWATDQGACRVFTRADGPPQWHSQFVGLRVVRVEKRGLAPADRRISADKASWAHLHQGPVFLACVLSSPRRAWAIRLEALGVKLTENEELANVVIMVPPKKQRSTKAVWTQFMAFRYRAQGIGSLVLEAEQADQILSDQEVKVHDLEQDGERWSELYGKKVFVIGRFRLTQKVLIERLKACGVLRITNPEKAELLIAGGGRLAKEFTLSFSGRELPILNEVECLAILDSKPALVVP